ncbi:MAG: glycoside hydrolase family 3 N-terminal domain-containing protein, partial [Eubacteriales bacterium]
MKESNGWVLSTEEEKKLERRRRRIRNQVISYISLIVLILLVVIGGFFAVKFISEQIEMKEQLKIEEAEFLASVLEAEEEEVVEVEEEEIEETEVVEYTKDELLDEIVYSCISEMSLEDKVAGLFFVTPEAITGVDTVIAAGDATQAALEEYPVGGLAYFAQNIQSEDQIIEMLANTVSMSKYPIFLGVDEEGGNVARLANSLNLDNVGTMAEIGETGDASAAYTAMETIGTYLLKYGFNVDFAPVADVLTNEDNTSIGTRSFSSDVDIVTSLIPSAVLGLQDLGISACLKHFPGQGDADGDTHDERASIDKTLEELMELEF